MTDRINSIISKIRAVIDNVPPRNKFDKIYVVIDHDHKNITDGVNKFNDSSVSCIYETYLLDNNNNANITVYDLFDAIDHSTAKYYVIAVVGGLKLLDYIKEVCDELSTELFIIEA